jgi:hypothetical protein
VSTESGNGVIIWLFPGLFVPLQVEKDNNHNNESERTEEMG